MTFSASSCARLGRGAIAALIIGLGSTAPQAWASETILAADASTITAKVTDEAGVLSSADVSSLEEQLKDLQKNQGRILYIVFADTLPGSAEDFARQVVEDKGPNSAVYVVGVSDRKVGVQTGSEWPQGRLDSMYEAAQSKLAEDDFAGSATALVDAAAGGSGSGSGGGSGAGWLAGGVGALALAGGGIAVASRRKTKKDSAATLESARAIEPGNTSRLERLDLPTLEKLAQEELVSTDESIRRGKEELDIAMAEFGPERTRAFTRAMNHSTTTLRRAFELQQRLDDAIPETEEERRRMLVEIVSSCGLADKALDEQAADFAQMRNLLINSSSKLDELTQRSVDIRTRLPQAQDKLAALQASYEATMLEAIAENPQMAQVSLDEAEKLLSQGREIAAQPAGQQGGLVAAIRDSEHALEVADRLLAGVENAESSIATAKAGLQDLIAEVESEVAEAQQLESQGKRQGTEADWEALDAVVARASRTAERARQHGSADPLSCYTELTSIDSELDELLDAVREATSTHSRQLQMLEQQLAVAQSTIQAAEDLISTRGRVVGAPARTALADAKRLHAQALQARGTDTRLALDTARQAVAAAQAAANRAQQDVDSYRRQQQRRQASSTAGDILTGMVIGQMLGGGHHHGGGFGGGFGGGSFGGGGGGGGFRGGSF
ncbi:TPM domain-containing protein [Corynebacterium sp.]|uniref:TPM domain-containing protein n=1 Tax=Corynebacterium sp. TaxID=1720 RepID=UPI0026DAB112|nr:TPM domain-containing protein [Corynebacterium sp.]MDO5031030.1 TPM domain-containing protein [Corynebacterium sp.]